MRRVVAHELDRRIVPYRGPPTRIDLIFTLVTSVVYRDFFPRYLKIGLHPPTYSAYRDLPVKKHIGVLIVIINST